jgi:hypothetical protein
LFIVADLARLLPRHWDGQRLMRFLAGLAMLALGCLASAAPATPVASTVEPAAPAPVTVVVAAPAAPAAPAAAESHEVRAADRVEPCWNGAHAVVPQAAVDVPAGVTPGAYGSRGPPAIRA